jgi:hypothetical protein
MKIIGKVVMFALLAGCGDDARLVAEARRIKADGTSSTTLTFHADQPDGTAVYFETDHGHFLDDGYEVETVTRSIASGQASIELYSSIYPGVATVLANTDMGDAASVTVEFVAMRPSGRVLSFECDAVNIGALVQPVPDHAVPCHLVMQDRDGASIDPRSLPPGDFGFIAEAGQIQPAVVDDGYGNVYFLYTARGGGSAPLDVEPIEQEPSRAGDTGGTRNPRDGLVTLVAWVRGEEGFHDINSNGLFEPSQGETFTDVGEPFVDVDDDGVFDPGSGDTYQDVDGNGRYTDANGTWDEDAVIWAAFKILWTGTVHQSSTTSRMELQGGPELRSGATSDLAVYLLDQNINPLAATSDDSLTLSVDNSYALMVPYTFTLSSTRGFEVDSHGRVTGHFETPLFRASITNTNTYPDPATARFTASAYVTPAPMLSDGTTPYQTTVELSPYEVQLLGDPSGGE